jgi:hypothetical protein
MSKTHRVQNVTRGIRLKLNQAERAVEACAAEWVEYGVSIRDVTLAEAIELRNSQAATRERMAKAELPGLKYDPPKGGAESLRQEWWLAMRADVFVERASRCSLKLSAAI